MKNLVVTVIVAIVVMASFSQANAQYAIPAFDVPVLSNTTFEDDSFSWSNEEGTREERKLKVRVNTSTSMQAKWILISVYKIGSPFHMGPFKVREGRDFTFGIDNDQWGITVLQASSNTSVSVWDEE